MSSNWTLGDEWADGECRKLDLTPAQVGALLLLARSGLGKERNVDLDSIPRTHSDHAALSEFYWSQVRLKAQMLDEHPSRDELLSLAREYGVPHWMGEYFVARLEHKQGRRAPESWMSKENKLQRGYLLALAVAEEHERGGTRGEALKKVAKHHNMECSTLEGEIAKARSNWNRIISDGRNSWPTKTNLRYIRSRAPDSSP